MDNEAKPTPADKPNRSHLNRRGFLPRLGALLVGLGMVFTGRPSVLQAQDCCNDCWDDANSDYLICNARCEHNYPPGEDRDDCYLDCDVQNLADVDDCCEECDSECVWCI